MSAVTDLSNLDKIDIYGDDDPKGFDKRLPYSLSLILGIALYFWTSSRYPALDEKAALGGENNIAAIAFDQIVSVSSSDSLFYQIVGNTLNWAYTNKQGMFFGILFAAAIMTFLKILNQKRFKGRFANTLLGVSIGAPLGVCVNCAVPIALGAQKSGARTETTLAILLSSPTLNMVVLGMTFSIFPFWLAALKLGATLAFILIAIPLAVYWFGPKGDATPESVDKLMGAVKTVPKSTIPEVPERENNKPSSALGWGAAFLWVFKEAAANLWYILKLTVPLMILAGLLGSIAVTLLPWHVLADITPTGTLAWLAVLGLIAVMGTFLPVPIAFDVVICAVLLAAGLDPAYVAVLLVTLGVFSIYPGLQIWHSISKRLAIGLFGMVVAFGIAIGLGANALSDWDANRQETAIDQGLSQASTTVEIPAGINPSKEFNLSGNSKAGRVEKGTKISSSDSSVEILSWPFEVPKVRTLEDGQIFLSSYGPSFGIDEPDNLSPKRFMVPIERNRSIAAGDVNDDGWPDVILTSDAGLSLYTNIDGTNFTRQPIVAPEIQGSYVMRSALIDIDGDEDLDILIGTLSDGVYSIENKDGEFKFGAKQFTQAVKGSATSAFAFGDIDRDGNLDAIIGNSAIGNNLVDRTITAARNKKLSRIDGQWVEIDLAGPDGETLSVLLSDLNNDGWLDMFVGNDYRPPDHLWLSDGNGGFETQTDEKLPDGMSKWTMSLASGDIDGDLLPETYAGNISGRSKALPRDAKLECRFETGTEKTACIKRLEMVHPYYRARRQRDAVGCKAISDPDLASGCALTALTSTTMRNGGTGAKAVGDLCEKIPANLQLYRELCIARRGEKLSPLTPEELLETVQSNSNANLLLDLNLDTGAYNDMAELWEVEDGGWTWNARFADIDQDGHQDLYVVNGHTIAQKRYEHKLFMNKQDHFADEAEAAGIASSVATTSYSFADFDRDGDIDIMTVPLVGAIKMFENTASQTNRQSIQFTLRSQTHNTHAIGAKIIVRYGQDGNLAQMRELQMSGGFASFDDPVLHFGLGDHETIKSVEVRWPDGQKTEISSPLAAGHRYEIRRQN